MDVTSNSLLWSEWRATFRATSCEAALEIIAPCCRRKENAGAGSDDEIAPKAGLCRDGKSRISSTPHLIRRPPKVAINGCSPPEQWRVSTFRPFARKMSDWIRGGHLRS